MNCEIKIKVRKLRNYYQVYHILVYLFDTVKLLEISMNYVYFYILYGVNWAIVFIYRLYRSIDYESEFTVKFYWK